MFSQVDWWAQETAKKKAPEGVVKPIDKKKAPQKPVVQEGVFAPAVKLTAQVMGRKELNAFRASVIAEHTKVISAFVDTSESEFGQIVLKQLFEAACVNRPRTTHVPARSSALSARTHMWVHNARARVYVCSYRTQLTLGHVFDSPVSQG